MSQLKRITFMFLLCLLFPAAELFALDSNANQQSLNQLNTGKTVVPKTNHLGIANIRSSLNNTLNRTSKSLDGTMGSIRKSLNGTTNRVKNSLDGLMGRVKKSLNGTMGGVKNSLDETMEGVGDFIDDAGNIAVVAGAVFIFMMAATDDNYYYYDYSWPGCYDHP